MKATREGREYSILIADDDRNSLETLREIIQPEGFQTLTASSATQRFTSTRNSRAWSLIRLSAVYRENR